MNKLFAIAALAALTGGCLQEKETQMIVVDGEGVVMATPDLFNLEAEIRVAEDKQADVLTQISQSVDKIGAQLPALQDLDSVEINSASIAVLPVRENECVRSADYEQRDACPIVRYQGYIRLTVKGSPATLAGNALSYLNELGAVEVRLTGYSFSNYDQFRDAATAAALDDARSKAARLADGMDVALGAPLRVQYGEGLRNNFGQDEDDHRAYPLAVGSPPPPAERFAPAVKLSLSPQPVEVREKITAAFAIESSKP